MVSHDVAGHHALDEHPFPAGIGVVEVHGSLKFVPCLPQGPRVSYIELDEPVSVLCVMSGEMPLSATG